jgi:hypothetical protein
VLAQALRYARHMNAYDYQRQQWIEGEPARELLISQLRDEIELLSSVEGERYARMVNGTKDDLLKRRQAELEELSFG